METRTDEKVRCVVSMRSTGLGDRIICPGAAWLFARNTGRLLIADWRVSLYARDWRENLFPRCFEPLAQLAGVDFLGDDRVAALRLPRSAFPEFCNREARTVDPTFCPAEMFLADRETAVAMIRTGRDVPGRTVIFNACVNDGLVSQ